MKKSIEEVSVEECRQQQVTHVFISVYEQENQNLNKLNALLNQNIPVLPSTYVMDYIVVRFAISDSYKGFLKNRTFLEGHM